MASERNHTKRKWSIKVPAPLSVLLLPLLIPLAIVGLPISIVWTKLTLRRNRSNEKLFRQRMEKLGRSISYSDIMKFPDDNRGTLLIETFSFKGPHLLWWTQDDVLKTNPFPGVSYEPPRLEIDEALTPFYEWLREQYTHPDHGKGLCVIMPEKTTGKIDDLFPGFRYLKIWPFGKTHPLRPIK